jgi:hypothetical protein
MKTKQTFWFRRMTGKFDKVISMHGTEAQAKAWRGLTSFCSRIFILKTGIEIPPGEIVEVEITFDVKKRIPVRRA